MKRRTIASEHGQLYRLCERASFYCRLVPPRTIASVISLMLLATAPGFTQQPADDCHPRVGSICGLGGATLVLPYPPAYPSEAARNRIEGWVDLEVLVDIDGRVLDVVVVASNPPGVFEEVAMTAAKRWIFGSDSSETYVVRPRIRFDLQ
jgi:TonB family protein